MNGIRVGLSPGGAFPQGVPPADRLLAAARHAEAAGFDALWSGDHVMMYSPIVDCVTLLAAFAGVTTRVRLGTAVFLVPLRHPVVTAKIFAGLDYVSNEAAVWSALAEGQRTPDLGGGLSTRAMTAAILARLAYAPVAAQVSG